MALGNLPRAYDVALVTSRLNRILEYEPADLTLTVQTGIAMGELASELKRNNQLLPLDAPPDATLGGVLATGSFGPWRHAYGPARDWVLGCASSTPMAGSLRRRPRREERPATT
jgi:glycolate oxidase FAD binding subunit